MHKKLFTAVLALGLLLFANESVFARASAPSDGEERPVVTTYGNGQSKAGLTPTAELNADPLVTVNGGQNRTVPGTFCDGNWYAPFGFSVGGWYGGNEFYAAYQNPQDANYWNGTCINSPSFDVTAINAIVRFAAGPFPATFSFQPLVFAVDVGCSYDGVSNQPAPVVGGALCAGPLYAFTWNAAASFLINLPFAVECCIGTDYYAAYYAATPGALRLGTTDGSMDADPNGPTSGTECLIFNDWGVGWRELTGTYFGCFNLTGAVPWGGSCNSLEHMIWSEGYTPDDLATSCTPGDCDYAFAYTTADSQFVRFEDGNDDWFTGFLANSTPAPTGALKFGIRFDALGEDTLKEFKFLVHEFFGTAGADELLVEIWDEGPATGCNGEKVPGALLYSVLVDSFSVLYYPFMNTIPIPDITFGTLNGGPERSIFATITPVYGVTGTAMGRPTSVSGCLTPPFRSHSLLYYPNWGGLGSPEWKYVGDRAVTPGAAGHFEFVMEGRICREILPAQEQDCGAGGPDQWSMYAHDLRQTSASGINIGDPNQVTLEWTTSFAALSNFTNPTVHNGIIYQSSDNLLNAVDLATGALIGTMGGTPEMSSSGNRGNTVVAFVRGLPSGPDRDIVFGTGGTFGSISAWEINLETSGPTPIWTVNPGGTSVIPGGLGAQARFNTSKVVDIGGVDVLFVLTEPPAGAGRLYALNANSGTLYGGWATNPLVLDAGAKHGPAIDGGKLFVGTAIGGSNVAGSLYQIDAATGVVDWNFINVPGEGWPSGVSVEGDFIYGASKDAANIGYRYKIDKSGALPSIVWTATQGTGLYATPTIGRDFVYFPLDNPSFGLLQVSKVVGTVARNLGVSDICGNTLFMVPQIATLSCDAYIFAGDRNGRWWLFNAVNGDAEWYREFPFITGGEIVNGTALASVGGVDYAVVSVRSLNAAGGQLSAYRLNAGPRPRLILCESSTTIEIPLNSGSGIPHTELGVLLNIGSDPLSIPAIGVSDPLPDGLASKRARDFRSSITAAASSYDGYSTIATSTNLTKREILAGLTTEMVDDIPATTAAFIASNPLPNTRTATRSMAADANLLRTSNIRVNGVPAPTSLAAGASGDLDWDIDGTGLGRGLDDEILLITNDDPDFNYDGSPDAFFTIHYIGGCAPANKRLLFNASDSSTAGYHLENVYNDGGLSGQHADDLVWDDDPINPETNLFDGGIILAGDSLPGVAPDGGAVLHARFYDHVNMFAPNPAPSTICGLDKFENVLLGTKRTGGCPGTPADIFGEIIITGYSDTNMTATPGSDWAAVGTDLVMTEVGSYDPLYGDFKLIHWTITDRDGVAKDIKFGNFMDWDVVNAYVANVGVASPALNGYFIWDQVTPGNAYGLLNVNQPSLYAGVDGAFDAPFQCRIVDNPTSVYPAATFVSNRDFIYGYINQYPGFTDEAVPPNDKSATYIKDISLAPNGSGELALALYGVSAASNNAAVIEAGALALAKRAARWAGYARGDVNDDGLVDLADVCWLQGGNPIYPAAYSGDVDNNGVVDAADVARLLSFVSGNLADQPEGAWRF